MISNVIIIKKSKEIKIQLIYNGLSSTLLQYKHRAKVSLMVLLVIAFLVIEINRHNTFGMAEFDQ